MNLFLRAQNEQGFVSHLEVKPSLLCSLVLCHCNAGQEIFVRVLQISAVLVYDLIFKYLQKAIANYNSNIC